MQLSKLQKHALRTVKNREKLKYLSLGIIPSSAQLNVEKATQRLINLDCCIHIRNNSDVLLTEFSHQLPEEGVLKKLNRFYAVFLRKVSQKIEQQNEQQNAKKQKEQNNAKNSSNKKGQEIQQLIDNIEKLTKLDDLIQKRRASNDKKFILILTNCMSRIYEEADKTQEIKKYKISKLQKQIQKLYVESHDQYLKLMEIKAIIDQTTKIIVVNQDQQQQLTDLEAKKLEENKEQKQQLQQQKSDYLDKQEGRKKQDKIKDLLVKRKRSKSKIERIPADQKLLKEYEIINQKIMNIKIIIENREEEERKLSQRQKNIEAEKIQFLKLMLRNGYYQSDGIWWILAKLAKNNEKISLSDLNNILDMTTKKHVISEYEVLKKQLNSQKQSVLPKIKQLPKQKQKQGKSQYHSLHNITYSKLMNISSQQNSMNIYREAKSYIVDWVRQERWKVRSLKHKPLEDTTYIGHEWKQKQIQRLRTCYPKQLYEKMLIYLFGSSKPLKMSHSFMFYLKQNRRKQSTAILNTTPSSQSALRSVDHLTRNNTNK